VVREDYVERTIRQIAEAVARLLGFARSGQHELAEIELDHLYVERLGLKRSLVARLSVDTLAALLGDKKSVAIELLRAEAELRLAQGRTADSRDLLAAADALRRMA
jgi:hypothetical protein